MARHKTQPQDDLEAVRQGVVEFIGAFALMFIGGGAIIMTNNENLVAIALAHGLAIGLMVAATGHISGGLFNPALTVGMVVTGRMPLNRGIVYVVAQLAGCIIGALALKAIFDSSQINAVELGTPLVGARYEVGAALLAEIIMTFFLMYVVYGTAVDKLGAKGIAPLAIGLTITMDIFAGGAVSGAAMNPARAFGPALVQGFWDNQWIYWVGPIAGAVVAAFLYNSLLMRGAITPEAGRVEVEPTTAQHEARATARRRKR